MACLVDTRLAPDVGMCRPIRPPKNLVLHLPTRRSVDPRAGIVYGAQGEPVGGLCADGYVRLGQHSEGSQYAHRLIWEAVHGPMPAGYWIDHVNGVRSDNRICNLDAVTPQENLLRALERGGVKLGAEKSNAKLTPAIVREIRQSVGRIATKEWARQLEVDPATVRAVRDGTTWRHVPCRGRLPAKPKWRRPK